MKFSLVSVAAVLAISASSASAVMPRSAIIGTHRRQSVGSSRDVLNDALRSDGRDSKAVSLNLRGGDDEGAGGLMQTLKVGFYFGLWYALNIVYNSKSKPRFRPTLLSCMCFAFWRSSRKNRTFTLCCTMN